MARAFATVSIGGIVVRDYRLVQGKSGTLFVTPPQRSWTGRGGQPHHTFVVDVPEPLRSEVQAKVLAAYEHGVSATKGGAGGIAGPGRAFGLAPRTLSAAQSSRRSEPFAATRTLTDGY